MTSGAGTKLRGCPRCSRHLEYPSWSSGSRGPCSIGFDQRVREYDELSHDAGQANFGRFTARRHGLVHGSEVRIEAGRDKGRHIESLTDIHPASGNEGLARSLSGLAGHRRSP